MTDRQHYTDPIDGARLRIASIAGGDLSVRTMTEGGSGITVEVPAEELLAMIDRTDPDAMRDYLRETSYRDDAEGGMTAAAIEDETDAAPTDPVALVIEARMLIETASQNVVVSSDAYEADAMLSKASDLLRTVINTQLPPEADSPEDVTEQPDPVDQMRESGRQLGEAWRALADAFRDASKR